MLTAFYQSSWKSSCKASREYEVLQDFICMKILTSKCNSGGAGGHVHSLCATKINWSRFCVKYAQIWLNFDT